MSGQVAVRPHAIDRFRERFPGLCRLGPSDESIRSTILACLRTVVARTAGRSESGDAIETVRTASPFAIRAVLLPVPGGYEVLTVLPGSKSKGDRAGQKARRAARRAAACSLS